MDKRLRPIDPFIARMEAKRQAEWAARLAKTSEAEPSTAATEKPSFSRAAGWWTIFRNIVLNVVGAAIFVGACLLLYDAVMRPTIAIAPISMPNELETKGYSSDVAAHWLRAALTEIAERARSRKSGAEVAGPAEIPDIVVPHTGLSVETIATQIRKLSGWGSRWHVSGSVIAGGDQQYELRLKIMNDGQSRMGSAPIKAKDIDELFDAGARQILEGADPYLLAASYSDVDPSKSMELAQRLAEYDPNGESGGFWAHVLISAILIDRKDFDRAIMEAEKAISFGRNSDALSTPFALTLRALFNRGTDTKFSVPHTNIGKALQEQGKLDDAIVEYKKAIEFDPKFATPHNNLGAALRRQGKLDDAIVEYKKAIEFDPKFALPHNNLGIALSDQGKLDDAIVEYKKAIEFDPKFAMPYNNLGAALRRQGKLDDAIVEYKKAIEFDPKFALPHNNLGDAFKMQNKLDEAIAEYKKANELDPNNSGFRADLQSALEAQSLAPAEAKPDEPAPKTKSATSRARRRAGTSRR